MTYLEQRVSKDYCPYCGESIELLIDISIDSQKYIEDCSVCCRPIQVSVLVDEDGTPTSFSLMKTLNLLVMTPVSSIIHWVSIMINIIETGF